MQSQSKSIPTPDSAIMDFIQYKVPFRKRKSSAVLLILVAMMAVLLGSMLMMGCNALQTLPQAQADLGAATLQARQQLAVIDPSGQTTLLKAQLTEAERQLAIVKQTAQTQPAAIQQETELRQQVELLKLKIEALPNSDQIKKLNDLLAKADEYNAKAKPYVDAAAGLGTASQPSDKAQALGQLLGLIPNYGWQISTGLSIVAWLLKQRESTDNKTAATSIASSLQAAVASGQATLSPAALATFDHIQTPTAKKIIDAYQETNELPSIREVNPMTATIKA